MHTGSSSNGLADYKQQQMDQKERHADTYWGCVELFLVSPNFTCEDCAKEDQWVDRPLHGQGDRGGPELRGSEACGGGEGSEEAGDFWGSERTNFFPLKHCLFDIKKNFTCT